MVPVELHKNILKGLMVMRLSVFWWMVPSPWTWEIVAFICYLVFVSDAKALADYLGLNSTSSCFSWPWACAGSSSWQWPCPCSLSSLFLHEAQAIVNIIIRQNVLSPNESCINFLVAVLKFSSLSSPSLSYYSSRSPASEANFFYHFAEHYWFLSSIANFPWFESW